ncbi:MAG: hypothetical protein IJ047_03720 [Paludibacteraceae bacterium]|nr:hypothetical protein [Paludibacteraceae bacterium]
MKILFVIDSFYTTNNGTSISAQRFAGELRKRGHEVRVLCWDTPSDQGTKDQVTKEVGCTKENNLTDGDFTTKKFNIPVFQPLCDKHDFSFAYNNKSCIARATGRRSCMCSCRSGLRWRRSVTAMRSASL